LRQKAGLVLGPALFGLVMVLPAPQGLEPAAWRTAAVALLMATWWVTEALPLPATALLPLALFPLLGIRPIEAAAAPYANPVIFLFLGGFLIAAALSRCGLHRRLALTIVRLVGSGPRRLVAGFMAATAFLSMWVSNSATVAMMLPMALSVLALAEEPGKRGPLEPALLLGIAYAASIGGVGTLIGTPPNALLAGFMAEAHGVTIGFAQWMMVGVPLALVALPLVWLLLVRWLHPLPEVGSARLTGALGRQEAALGPLSRGEQVVGVITALVAASWLLRPLLARWLPGLSDAGIAITGAVLLFLVPISLRPFERGLGWEEAEKLPWGVLILFGGGLSLAGAIQVTGLAGWIGEALAIFAVLPFVLLVAGVAAVVIFLTELTSNTATAAAFLPIVAALAVGLGADPLALAVPAALAASCAFMLPVATPPNAIVFGSGRVSLPQMARAGIWINLLMIGLVTFAVFALVLPLLGR
jgi:solute carrier family 13 (sodium-dependent dicarboxylate transporter), member 2/3/5